MGHKKLVSSLVILALSFADCVLTWVKPVNGNGPCGSVDENIALGPLPDSTDIETTSSAHSRHYNVITQPPGIVLSIHGQGTFHLDQGTIDYESITNMVVVVEATDNQPSTSTGTCTIAVNDVNDNAPEFPANVEVPVDNQAPAGTVVTTFTATDADGSSPNKDVTNYNIAAGNNGDMAIDSVTGQVTVAVGKTTDCDAYPVYTLTITAQDGGTPSNTGTGTLTVNVDGCGTTVAVGSTTTDSVGGTTTDADAVGSTTTDADAVGSTTTDAGESTTTNEGGRNTVDVLMLLLGALIAAVARYFK